MTDDPAFQTATFTFDKNAHRKLVVSYNAIPAVAASRKELADHYRSARRENPALARLLYKCVKRTKEELVRQVFSGSGSGAFLDDI